MDITKRFNDAKEICRKTAGQKAEAERKRYEKEMAENAKNKEKVRVRDGNPLTENIEKPACEAENDKNKKKVRVRDGISTEEYAEKLAREKVKKDIQREIGNRLFQIRSKNNLTQEEMAKKCSVLDLSKSGLSRWENGERFPDWLFLFWICSEFGENLHWILTGEGEQEEKLMDIATDLEKIVKRLRQH